MASGDRLPVGVKFYTPIAKTPAGITGNSTWQTLYSVNGAGYLSKAVAGCNTAVSVQLRITIDGVVIFSGISNATANNFTGLLCEQYANMTTTAGNGGIYTRVSSNVYTCSSLATDYPFTAATQGYSLLIDAPIQFKSSLLIEVNSSGTIYTNVMGGLI